MLGRLCMSSLATARWCRVVAVSYLSVSFAPFVALLEHQLLFGQEVVREYPVELPDLIEFGQFGCPAVAEISDQLAHTNPLLPHHVSTVVTVASRDLVKVISVPTQ